MTRARLIAAARRLFAAKGVEATTVAEIAAEADVAVGSFYNYFETKDELLAALMEGAVSDQLGALQARQAAVTDPAEAISVAHRHLVRLATEEPDLAWLIVRFEVPFRVCSAALGGPARRDIRDGLESGRFRIGDPEVALQASGGALFAVLHGILVGQLGPGAAVDHAAGVLRSLGVDPAEAAEIAARPLPDAEPDGAD